MGLCVQLCMLESGANLLSHTVPSTVLYVLLPSTIRSTFYCSRTYVHNLYSPRMGSAKTLGAFNFQN